jgi:site-specific DNA recombinase
MKRAAIYARVSTDEQAEKGYSLPSQLEACRRYADQYGYEIIGEFSDDYSGRKLNRPELDKVRDLICARKVDALIVYSPDRLVRDLGYACELRRERNKYHVELCRVLGGQTESTPQGEFTEDILNSAASFESKLIVERTRRGKIGQAKAGKMILQGYPPYGYDKEGKGKEAKLIPDVQEVKIVRSIFELYTRGNGDREPKSLRAIANYLDLTGAPLPDKGMQSGTYWSPFTVRKILTNEIYAGRTYYGKSRVVDAETDKREYLPKDKWIPIDVPALAIIDRETFQAAAAQAQRNKELAKRNRKNSYLLSGYLRCGRCGATIVGHMRYHALKTPNQYYRCGSSWRGVEWSVNNGAERCHIISIDTVCYKLDNAVWDWIKNLLCDPEALESGLSEMMRSRADEAEKDKERLDNLNSLIAENESRIKRLVKEMANYHDDTVIEAFRQEIGHITAERDSLVKNRDRLASDLNQLVITQAQKEEIMSMAAEIAEEIEDTQSNDEKRKIMEFLKFRGIFNYEDGRKWLEVSCGITIGTDVIELSDSTGPLPGRGRAGRPPAPAARAGCRWRS